MKKWSELDPEGKFARFMKIFFLVCAIMMALGLKGCSEVGNHSDKKPHEVTLINAYSSMQKCGGKNNYTCEVFTGRFRDDEGRIFVREMDGFFYHRYVDEGKKDIEGASITVTDYNLGYKDPSYVDWFIITGIIGSILTLFGAFFGLFATFDVEEAQRKWEREQREKEFNSRWED